MAELQVLKEFCWPGMVAVVLLVQFVTICLLRRRVRKLEGYEHWYNTQYQQRQPSHFTAQFPFGR